MQGFNMGRYVPPDLEGTTTGNRLHGRRAPGAGSTPTVRFEMPFAVWCASCPQPTLIGQGVRFNAEKRRVGSYYSTPIWSFRIKHADCGGALEIRTDPQNTAYVVASGGTKRDTGPSDDDQHQQQLEGGEGGGGPRALTDQERQALRSNAFASLEKTIADRQQLLAADERISGLLEASARDWDDPYARNQRLRRAFRADRHARERDAAGAQDLRDRMSLSIELVPATEEDARRAALVEFGTTPAARDADADADERVESGAALAKPLFAPPGGASKTKTIPAPGTKKPASKAEMAAAKTRAGLVSELVTKSRAAHDPFLRDPRAAADAKRASSSSSSPSPWPGVKRKRTHPTPGDELPPAKVPAQQTTSLSGLVQYDSD